MKAFLALVLLAGLSSCASTTHVSPTPTTYSLGPDPRTKHAEPYPSRIR